MEILQRSVIDAEEQIELHLYRITRDGAPAYSVAVYDAEVNKPYTCTIFPSLKQALRYYRGDRCKA